MKQESENRNKKPEVRKIGSGKTRINKQELTNRNPKVEKNS
jgi:hypothetical protein